MQNTIAVWFKIDGERVTGGLQEAAGKLDAAGGQLVLDFSSVRRVSAGAIREMEKLASRADEKAVKIGLRGVNIDIYRVLKLTKLGPRFSLLS
jgi:anti-anti-sigma regulatory factor